MIHRENGKLPCKAYDHAPSAMNRPIQNVDALNLWHRCEKRGFRNHLEDDLMGVMMRMMRYDLNI